MHAHHFCGHGLSGFGNIAPFLFFTVTCHNTCLLCVGLCIVLYSIMQHVAIPCIHYL